MKTTAYHGTIWGGFEKFDDKLIPDFGMFFTDDEMIADGYAGVTEKFYEDVDHEEENYPVVYEVVLTMENPLVLDAEGRGWEDVDGNETSSREFARLAKLDGYDGLVIKNVLDCGPYCDEFCFREATTFVVFNSNQIEIL